MNHPKISVIVPVYNGESYLKKCMQSLIEQSFFPYLEILLIDDGSTDSSGAIADQYALDYTQIRCFHIPNGGVSNARNLGLSHACGTYVAFVDSDDWVDPDYYETMYAHSNDGQLDLVAAGAFIDDGNRTLLSIQATETVAQLSGAECAKRFLRGDLDVHVFDKLFKRTITNQICFNPAIRIGEDKLYLYEALARTHQACLIPQCFYHYYQNPRSVMHQSFSEKHLDDIPVGQRILEITQETYPELTPYAQCMNINALCRIVGELSLCPALQTQYRHQYQLFLRQIRAFSMVKSIRHSSKKHWISLLIAKISPKLYGRLRGNNRLRYTKL